MPFYVNAVEITDEQVFTEMQHHPSSSADEAMSKAARALAIREMLLQEAKRLGLQAPDTSVSGEVQDEYLINCLLEQYVEVSAPDEKSCMSYYTQNHSVFCDTAGNVVPFAYVQGAIAAYLKDASWQAAVKQYIQTIIGKTQFAGISLPEADTQLVS